MEEQKGSNSDEIVLFTNYYQMALGTNKVSKYSITVEPEIPSNSRLMKAILYSLKPEIQKHFKLFYVNNMTLYCTIEDNLS